MNEGGAHAPATAALPDARDVLTVRNLSVSYFVRGQEVRAVRDVDLTVRAGETLAVVGESGSGKSTLAFAVMRGLDAAGRVTAGSIRFNDIDLLGLGARELRAIQGSRIAMVYQDPQTALNPAFRVGDQIGEVVREHTELRSERAAERVRELLAGVNLPDPAGAALRYPHELSGGQQQRVLIAMAFACNPELLIMDEPTTGLDVTTEAHILDLVAGLKQRYGAAILYITHNLGVVARFCHRVAVMYAGEMVEEGPVSRVFASPAHPYTRSLLTCIPRLDLSKRDRPLNAIEGQLPSLSVLPDGCIFADRCEHATDDCRSTVPPSERVGDDPEDTVRCLHWRSLPAFAFERHVRDEAQARADARSTDLLNIGRLQCYYPVRRRLLEFLAGRPQTFVHAVDGIDIELEPRAHPVHRGRERLRQDHAGPRRGWAPARFRRRPDVRGQPAGGPRARPRTGASPARADHLPESGCHPESAEVGGRGHPPAP